MQFSRRSTQGSDGSIMERMGPRDLVNYCRAVWANLYADFSIEILECWLEDLN